MTDLIAFITARLDEDEAAANAAAPGPWSRSGPYVGAEPGIIVQARFSEDAAHIARHDPARVLREVEVGRWMLSETERWMAAAPTFRDGMLRRIATAWSDHQDYRQEWRP
jgi:hypothetical protein